MLYKIAIGGVEHYREGQDPLVYLVSAITDVLQAGIPWVFSNGNCGARLTEYYDDLTLLDTKVDWPLQMARMWRATADDPTRATRRAAEFLVHQRLPWSLVRELVVRTEATASTVRELLTSLGQNLRVVVRPDWYYQGHRFH
jgi:ssDNA thymidine ADP-ribosyltransferase, DarT